MVAGSEQKALTNEHLWIAWSSEELLPYLVQDFPVCSLSQSFYTVLENSYNLFKAV